MAKRRNSFVRRLDDWLDETPRGLWQWLELMLIGVLMLMLWLGLSFSLGQVLAMLLTFELQPKTDLGLVLGFAVFIVLGLGVLRGRWLEFIWASLKNPLTFKTNSKGENWATMLGWFIPRKHRNQIIGDILEDCAEMRDAGCAGRRIKFHVVYQWLIAVVTLVPMAVKTSIIDILKHVLSSPK